MEKLLLWLVLLLPANTIQQLPVINFVGKVTAIKDGDTFEVLHNGKAQTIRLAHIDCPEKSQPFGNNAKQFAADLCFGRQVRVVGTNQRDRYKRTIAVVYVADSINVNKALVQAGLAWHFTQYSNDTSYSRLEQTARKHKVGLWQHKNVTPPWLWRKPKPKPKQQ